MASSALQNITAVVASQLRYLVTNVNKKNYKSTSEELKNLVSLYGTDAQLQLLRFLIESTDFKDGDGRGQKDQQRIQLLAQELSGFVDKPYFHGTLLRVLEVVESVPDDFVSKFSKAVKLSLAQEITLALSLATSVEPKIQQEGFRFLKGRLPDLSQPANSLPESVLHSLLYFFKTHEGFAKQEANVMRALTKHNPTPLSVLPLTEAGASANARIEHIPRITPDPNVLLTKVANSCRVADLLEDLGYSCCSSIATLKEVLQQFPALREADVASIVALMVRTYSGLEDSVGLALFTPGASADGPPEAPVQPQSWNVNVFVDTVKELQPKLNWHAVAKSLDMPGFYIPDQKGFTILLNVFKRATKEPFPISVAYDNWTNTKGQLSLLRHALETPVDSFDWGVGRDHHGAPASLPWHSVPLVRALLRLAEVENYGVVRTAFEKPLKQCPEVLLLTLAKIKRPTYVIMHSELSSILFSLFLSNHSSSGVLGQLWSINRGLLIRSMVDLYSKDKTCLSRILDVAHDLKAITTILDARPFSFVIDLAVLAAHREFLYLEKWLNDKIAEHETPFIKACILYLKEKTKSKESGIPVSLETLNIFFKCLHAKSNLLSPDMVEELKQLYAAHHLPTPVQDTELGSADVKFPPEIEEQSNQIFRQIYRSELSIPQAIQLLKNLKESKEQRDELVFLCIIHNLFDEYRYFPRFPEKELQITGLLFGALIQHQLISYIPLGMALRYVLEALRKPPGSNMFTFGVTALEQFKSRLSEWPQYCSHILQIPHLRTIRPDLIAYIEKLNVPSHIPALSAPPAAAAPAASPAPTAPVESAPLPPPKEPPKEPPTSQMATRDEMNPNAEKLRTLLNAGKPVPEPEEAVQDKIAFIINNLSSTNMDQKVAQFREALKPEFYPWFAQYLIAKRVSLEPNFHHLYQQFLDRLRIPELYPHILRASIENAKALLRSEKIKESISERALLKNLGSWLGQLTLARNRPLLHKDLYLKGVMVEAFESGRLIAAVPFVCKILESCKSKVFSYPNVWVAAQLRMLMEVYNIPNLKLNLKIEIELLFNNLGIKMEEIKPSTILLQPKRDQVAQPPTVPGPGPAPVPTGPHVPPGGLISAEVVTAALDRAIKEIITPVVERSGSIACVTTRELVLKDFAAEPDETKVRKAAQFMVQNLAASLAMVTCKEPLRVSVSNHLRLLTQNLVPVGNEAAQLALENAIQSACTDNIEFACGIIEKAAREKAARDMDEALAYPYQQRKKHREAAAGRPFFDPAYASQRFAFTLPDLLRPHAGDALQMRVYEDFSRLRIASPPPKPDAAVVGTASPPPASISPPANPPPLDLASSPPIPSPLMTPAAYAASPPPAVPAVGPAAAPKLPAIGVPIPGKAKPAGMQEQVKLLFEEWLAIRHEPVANEKVIAAFLQSVAAALPKSEDMQVNFFRLWTDICIEYHDRQNPGPPQHLSYTIVDAFSLFIVLLVKAFSDPTTKILLLQSIFNGVTSLLLSDFELKKAKFDQRPYYRLLVSWLEQLPSDPNLEPLALYVQVFGASLVKIRPAVVPAFAFAWVELIFHRLYMPKLLLYKGQKGWPMFKRLLVELLRFLEPYLRIPELTEPIRLLYKGTLKALLVLLHDFPEFLCDYHYSFCDVIPPTCIQLRNIILSAFPRSMHLPDPFTPNLKVDRLPEISQPPHILSDYTSALQKGNFKAEIDNFLKTRAPAFLHNLRARLLLSAAEAAQSGTHYNVPMINALVMYVGTQAILQNSRPGGKSGAPTIARSAPMEIFLFLARELDPEGRYFFLNAVANQLRYPNNHTHYFSCVLLYLFAEAGDKEIIKEQITRVLLERLIVNRPHPWGLLITFLEIIKNPRYNFWQNSFTKSDPDLKRLFDSVSRTCMVPGKTKAEHAAERETDH